MAICFLLIIVFANLSTVHAIDESISRLATPPQQGRRRDEVHDCVPCSDIAVGGNRHGRQLQFFSKLRDGVKDTLTPRSNDTSTSTSTTNAVASESSTDMMDTFITSDFFMGNNETTIGQIFLAINSNPELKFGVYALALVIILPLIALEATSIGTQTPIICILNLSETTPFMGPCSDFARKRLRRRLGSHESKNNYYGRHLEGTFLQSYFNGTVESLRIPDMDATDSNVTVQLMKIVDYGLSDGVFDMMNNVTIANVIDEIAISNNTRPYLTATVLAMLPVLILNRVENTPTSVSLPITSCSGESDTNCTRPHRSLSVTSSAQSTVSVDKACEMEFIQCQIQNIFELFDQ
jgi:hypothetical protein